MYCNIYYCILQMHGPLLGQLLGPLFGGGGGAGPSISFATGPIVAQGLRRTPRRNPGSRGQSPGVQGGAGGEQGVPPDFMDAQMILQALLGGAAGGGGAQFAFMAPQGAEGGFQVFIL